MNAPTTSTAESIDRDLAHEDAGFDLADAGPETTGLPFVVCLQQNVWRRLTHGPRLLVYQRAPRHAPLSISVPMTSVETPRVVAGEVTVPDADLASVFEFVGDNREVLCRYWADGDYSTREMLDDIRAVARW